MWTPIQWSDRDVKVIPSKMFLKEKKDAQGNVTKIKSRLVAGGHLQNKEDFQDLSSSPTLPYPSLLILSLWQQSSIIMWCLSQCRHGGSRPDEDQLRDRATLD
jgi:hypothetical protein